MIQGFKDLKDPPFKDLSYSAGSTELLGIESAYC
jgi:hypothetical protein